MGKKNVRRQKLHIGRYNKLKDEYKNIHKKFVFLSLDHFYIITNILWDILQNIMRLFDSLQFNFYL